MGDTHVQSGSLSDTSLSYQVRQEKKPDVMIDQYQSLSGEERLAAYYRALCQMRDKDASKEG